MRSAARAVSQTLSCRRPWGPRALRCYCVATERARSTTGIPNRQTPAGWPAPQAAGSTHRGAAVTAARSQNTPTRAVGAGAIYQRGNDRSGLAEESTATLSDYAATDQLRQPTLDPCRAIGTGDQ